MIAESQLSLSANSWSLIASIIVVIVTASIGCIAWKQSGFSTTRGLQELFRLLIVGFVALLLNQPEWVEQYQPDSKPTVVVLWDDSHSMQTQDASGPSSTQSSTRAQAISDLKNDALWSGGSENNREIVFQPIGATKESDNQGASGTDLARPLLEAASNIDQLLAVVLISDGDWNSGDSPVDAASRLKLKGVPLHTIPIGSPTRLPDVELASIECADFRNCGKGSADSIYRRECFASRVCHHCQT